LVSLFIDIDGTVDDGRKGHILPRALDILADHYADDGFQVFVTNRDSNWVLASIVRPIVARLRDIPSSGGIFLACEQGTHVSQVELSADGGITLTDLCSWPLAHHGAIVKALRRGLDTGCISGRLRPDLRAQVCFEIEGCSENDAAELLPDIAK